MTADEFLAAKTEPATYPPLLRALWCEAHGHWQRAHEIAQEVETRDGSWVHAYLHRREGDQGNASYWYQRAGKSFPTESMDNELRTIVATLLRQDQSSSR